MASVFSLKGIVFISIGSFVMPLVVGGGFFLLQRLITKVLMALFYAPRDWMVVVLPKVGWVLFIGNAVVTVLLAKVLVGKLF